MNMIPEVLELVLEVRLEMRLGRSISGALGEVLDDRPGKFFRAVENWVIRTDSGQPQDEIFEALPILAATPARKASIQLLNRGLNGFSIDTALGELEEELLFIAGERFERRLAVLPLKLMVPLTLFILPAVLILLISPLLFFINQGS